MIIGLSGYAKTGKDTAADWIEREFNFTKLSFAQIVRDCMEELNPVVSWTWQPPPLRYKEAVDIFGYNEAKETFPELRNLLQLMGTNVGRGIFGNDIWVNALKQRMHNYQTLDYSSDFVISDVRFPNEYDFVKSNGGVMIRVERTGFGPINDHISEVAIDEYKFDYHLHNNSSLMNFRLVVSTFMNLI